MPRRSVSTGSPWEPLVGYSRAVRIANIVAVAGTTATDSSGCVAASTAYEQTKVVLQKIKSALESVDATLEDVIRTRIYVMNIDDWEDVGRAHAEYFADIRPASTMVEVKRLIDPAMLVEIEADAVVDE